MNLKKIKHLMKDTFNKKKFKFNSIPLQYFSSEDAKTFLFFQFNSGNTKFFFNEYNKLKIQISDIPHYNVAQASLINGDKKIEAKDKYLKYIKASWPSYELDTSRKKIEERYQNHLKLIKTIHTSGKLDEPIILTQIPGRSEHYVVDGNHRCSIAVALGLTVPTRVIDFPLAFDKFMHVDEFYGTSNKNMPYQSIYINRKVVRKGRRDDIYDRLDLIPQGMLKEKRILDVGCNIGMNAIGTFKQGAKEVVGLEISQKMVNFATRLAVFDNSYPNVDFRKFNVNTDRLPKEEKYDLAFMLSIHHHLKGYQDLARIAKENILESIIFEGHPNTEKNDYKDFLDAVQFSKIEQIGRLATSVFDRKPSRPLWILYK